MPTSRDDLPSTHIGRQRLLKGAALLEADAARKDGIKFDFGLVGRVSDRTDPVSCGTVGCALGLFGLSGAFKASGLSCTIARDGHVYLSYKGAERGDTFDAAAKFFQIEREEANYLFSCFDDIPNEGVGARAERAIAKRLRTFVAGKLEM